MTTDLKEINQKWIEIKKLFISDEELASVLKVSETELIAMNSSNFEGLTEFVENLYYVISEIKGSDAPNANRTYRLLSQVNYEKDFLFPISEISDDGVKTILNHEFDMTDGSKLIIPAECRTEDSYILSGRLRETLDATILKLYEKNHLGENASAHDQMNRIIAEGLFNQSVKVGEVFSYDGIMDSESSRLGLVSIDKEELTKHEEDRLRWYPLTNYAGKIEHAYELINKLADMGLPIRLSNKSLGNKYWWCYLDGETPHIVSQAETMMEAVCHATVQWLEKQEFIDAVNKGIDDANNGRFVSNKKIRNLLKPKP